MQRNIYPIFSGILQKEDKELLLRQRSKVLWMSGLSGAGKSTIAIELEKKLYSQGFLTQILDGDNVRAGVNNNLGFSDIDRTENIRRIAEVSKLIVNSGVIVINSFISPNEKVRELAQDIIGKENFINVFINASLFNCEKRDVKGLYKKARNGEITNFTGIDSIFEPPQNADIEIKTDEQTVEDSVIKLLNFILPLITYK